LQRQAIGVWLLLRFYFGFDGRETLGFLFEEFL
jgi:hypothetical protein